MMTVKCKFWMKLESQTRLLGNFLEILDYETNLFSGWILRTLAQEILYFSADISESDYKTFICWLYDEFNIIYDNPDMSREQFFSLMNKVFHKALKAILDGKGLLSLNKLIPEDSEEEEEEELNISSEITITSNRTSLTKNKEEISNELESKIDHYETILFDIIEATYYIFGKKLDYMLIQSTAKEENVIYYKIPYHFRKPKVIKKLESTKKPLAKEKPKKKKKSKENVKSIKENLADSASTDHFILPLAEAIESYEVMHTKVQEEKKTEA